eukprot:TRINITY_DN6514_c0_g1_i3.p1 TRINITY_DN6514_c0_g1~~TRINITY_DN6514_c0_g1_i3.p1  ORF type:complete len:512 (+),score=143.35 TRINITY_DN6514_c0_g1_i3:636-2171(+)
MKRKEKVDLDEEIMKKWKEREESERIDFVYGTSPSNPEFFSVPSTTKEPKHEKSALEVSHPSLNSPNQQLIRHLSGDSSRNSLGPHRGLYSLLSYNSILPYLPTSMATPLLSSKWDLRGQANDLGRSILEKGLTNQTGQNNCFLNVIIQSLWHLREFRTKFIEHDKHVHYNQIGGRETLSEDTNCPYCALKLTFTQYQFSEDTTIPPDALRDAMSYISSGKFQIGSIETLSEDTNCPYCALKLTFTQYQFSEDTTIPPDALRDAMSYISSGKFQIGSIEDAAELFDTLLLTIHQSMSGSFDDDKVCSCLVHESFGMKLIEFVVCECGKKGRHAPYRQFIHYVPAQALRKIASEFLYENEEGMISQGISLDKAIRRSNRSEPQTCVDPDCKMNATRRTFISNTPRVLTLGFVWDTSEPTLDVIFDLLMLISPQLELKEMFDSCPEGGTFVFRGMVCYYGKHYNAYFKNRHTEEWIVFDDTTVKKVGKNWIDVAERCRNGRFQPLLLFYEKKD